MRSPVSLAALPLLGLALNACLFDGKDTKPTVRPTDEPGTGRILTRDGAPAVNARVRIYPVDHIPDSSGPAYSALTDAEGRYTVGPLPAGEYNILGENDGEYSYLDSVFLSDATVPMPTDTLDPAGSVIGFVALQPNHDPRTAVVQALGTNSYSNVDSAGRFRLGQLGAGRYTLRVTTILSEYTALFTGIRVEAGKESALSDTLRIPFVGIPVVTGLRAALDTINGVARISWSPIAHPRFHSYLVYRDTLNALNLSRKPLNSIRLADTVFSDTLYRSPGDTGSLIWEYRVRVQDVDGNVGPNHEVALLSAVAPRTARTDLQLQVLGGHGDSATINDTVRIVGIYQNPTYAARKLAWTEGSDQDTLRAIVLEDKYGRDTLVWKAPGATASRTLTFWVTDAAGRQWRDSVVLHIVSDVPVTDAGRDSTVSFRAPLILRGKASNRFDRILKWEWDIGGTGTFLDAPGGTVTVDLPKNADPDFPCVLRVTDEDGNSDLDTVRFDLRAARSVGTLLLDQPGWYRDVLFSEAWHDSIAYAVDNKGRISVEIFDPVSRKSKLVSERISTREFPGSAFAGGRLYLIYSDSIFTFDLGNGMWAGAKTSVPTGDYRAVALGERIYMVEAEGDLWQFDTATKIWTQKAKSPDPQFMPQLSTFNDKIYVMGNEAGTAGPFLEYNPATDTWKDMPNPPDRRQGVGMAWVNGKLYVLGGGHLDEKNTWAGVPVDNVDVFDPVLSAWSTAPRLLSTRRDMSVTVLGNNLYLVGGTKEPRTDTTMSGYTSINDIEEYPWAP